MKIKSKNLNLNFRNKRNRAGGTNTPLSNVHVKTDSLGDQSNTQTLENTAQSCFVSRLRDFPLLGFIECTCDSNYTSIIKSGKPKQEEIYDAWINILSQFYSIWKNENQSRKREILLQLSALRRRASIVSIILNSIGMFKNMPSLIKIIHSFDEEFKQFEFTDKSYENDLMCIKNYEHNFEIEYRELKDELEKLQKIENNTKKTNEQQDLIFYEYVADYNEIFKTSISVANISTLEYANILNRRESYIASQQNNNNNG